MLNDADASGFKKVYLAMGFTDLRRGIDGLATIVRFQFKLDPYDKNTLFLFCGRRCDRIKALLWEVSVRRRSGKAMVFSLCTRDSIMVHSGGPVRQMRQWRSQTTSTVC